MAHVQQYFGEKSNDTISVVDTEIEAYPVDVDRRDFHGTIMDTCDAEGSLGCPGHMKDALSLCLGWSLHTVLNVKLNIGSKPCSISYILLEQTISIGPQPSP